MAADFVLYTMDNCPWCVKTKALLEEHGIDYTELKYKKDFTREELVDMLGPDVRPSLPKLFVGGRLIGGYEATVNHLGRERDA